MLIVQTASSLSDRTLVRTAAPRDECASTSARCRGEREPK
jgi:hypothetical protein